MAIKHLLQKLMSFSFVADRVAQGRLALEFSIAQGELRWLIGPPGSAAKDDP